MIGAVKSDGSLRRGLLGSAPGWKNWPRKELTDKRLRRGAFTSVAELAAAITTWAQHWNLDPKPFVWKATAEDIIATVQRGRDTLRHIKSQTDHWGIPIGAFTPWQESM